MIPQQMDDESYFHTPKRNRVESKENKDNDLQQSVMPCSTQSSTPIPKPTINSTTGANYFNVNGEQKFQSHRPLY